MKEGRVCFCHFRQQSQKFKRKPKPNQNPMMEKRTHHSPQPSATQPPFPAGCCGLCSCCFTASAASFDHKH